MAQGNKPTSTLACHAAMATINVRKLNDEVFRKLEQRAAANNRSLEGGVRYILACAVEDDDMTAKREAFKVLAEGVRKITSGRPQTPSEVLIRDDRDSGHGGG